jgi:hypothetical protein
MVKHAFEKHSLRCYVWQRASVGWLWAALVVWGCQPEGEPGGVGERCNEDGGDLCVIGAACIQFACHAKCRNLGAACGSEQGECLAWTNQRTNEQTFACEFTPSTPRSVRADIPASPYSGVPTSPANSPSGSASICTRSMPAVQSVQGAVDPFQLIEVGALGYCPGDRVSVRLDSASQSFEVPALSVQPLSFVAPVWMDYTSGAPVAADVTLSLVDRAGLTRRLGGTLHLNALPASSNAANLGVATLEAIASVRQALGTANSNLSRYSGDTSDVLIRLASSDGALAVLANSVSAVQASASARFDLTLASGLPVRLDRASLAQLDAFFAALDDQTASAYPGYRFLAIGDSTERGFVRRAIDATLGGDSSLIRRLIGSAVAARVLVGAVDVVLAEPLLLVSALIFFRAIVSPARDAYTVQLGEELLGPPADRATVADEWRAVQPQVSEAFESTSVEPSQPILPQEPPPTTFGDAAKQLLDAPLGADIDEDVSELLVGPQESCARGALPTEISFKPYSVKCPEDECPGGALPTEISYNPYGVTCPGARESPSPSPPPPSPNPPQPSPNPPQSSPNPPPPSPNPPPPEPEMPPAIDVSTCPHSRCGPNSAKERIFCQDYTTYTSFYLVDGRRIQCGDFRITQTIAECDARANAACQE